MGGLRGMEVQEVTPDLARRFRLKEQKGVVVIDVESGSPADEAGIIPGDLILEINKQPIKNSADYSKVISGLKGDALVRTQRGYFIVKEKFRIPAR
jgi:S1-C subfamily serine protease